MAAGRHALGPARPGGVRAAPPRAAEGRHPLLRARPGGAQAAPPAAAAARHLLGPARVGRSQAAPRLAAAGRPNLGTAQVGRPRAGGPRTAPLGPPRGASTAHPRGYYGAHLDADSEGPVQQLRAFGDVDGSRPGNPVATTDSNNTGAGASFHLTEAVPPNDPRVATAWFQANARKDAVGLHERGAFRVVKEKEGFHGADVIRGQFVYTLKNVRTREKEHKARFVAQGQNEKDNPFVVHNLATLWQRSMRMLVSIAAVLGFRIFADEITQAYLQSQGAFGRVEYVRPRPADRHLFGLADAELLLLLLPLFGVCDAGVYWYDTFAGHVKDGLVMRALISDPAMLYIILL